MRSWVTPITSALSRRVQFKGKTRTLDALGLGLSNLELVPPEAHEIRCIEGIRMDLSQRQDIMTRELYLHGFYQDDVLVALRNLLHPGDVFWDIGANQGFMSVYVDRVFEGQVHTVAFEPSPPVIQVLRRNLSLNHCRAVEIEACCLSNEAGTLPFYTSATNSWNATLIREFAEEKDESEVIDVQATTLDEAVTRLPPPSVLKLDVEGAETRVLEGGRQRLCRSHPPIIAEFNHESIEAAGLSLDAYLDAYRDLGYRPHNLARPWVGWRRWESLHPVHDAASLPSLCNLVMLGHEHPAAR
jgi:FkbM family methyltransferase